MDFTAIGWREVIMIVVALAALYLAAALLRLGRLKRGGPVPAVRPSEPTLAPVAQQATVAPQVADFGEQLFRSGIEAELQQLRSEVATLREELKLIKVARRVSPQYTEAMLLAQRGVDAASVAEQCGISVGEAELVLALSRNKQEYEDDGDNDTPWSARN